MLEIAQDDLPEPGIYFGMDEEFYHALPYYSSSFCKNILISPMDAWARSWMNPLRHDVEETDVEKEDEAKIFGKAYHKRILEGRDAFYRCYAPTFTADKEGMLVSSDDMKDYLRENFVKGYSSKNKPELIEMVQMHDPSVPIYDLLAEEYREDHKGKTFIRQRLINRIEVAAAMIENHPYLYKCFQGGFAEVTIIWREDNGMMFKSRLDYLKPSVTVDLKTFMNKAGRTIERAMYTAVSSYRYHIQVYTYNHAVGKAIQLARQGKVFGENKPDAAWLELFVKTPPEEHEFCFVFQQKGIAPVARGMMFPKGRMFYAGEAAFRDAVEAIRYYLTKYGTDPWVDETMIGTFEDDSFPAWATEI